MRFTSPSRRALGLLAVSTIGLSTAVLGATGIASAAPELAGATAAATQTEYEVPDGACAMRWAVVGGTGDVTAEDQGIAGLVYATTRVTAGDTYVLSGGDAASSADTAGEDSSITGPGAFSIIARGGSDGVVPRTDNVVAGAAAASIDESNDYDGQDDGTLDEIPGIGARSGAGAALSAPVACPQAPTAVIGQGTDGGAEFRFTPEDERDIDPLNYDAAFEVSVDGAAFEPIDTVMIPDHDQYTPDRTFVLDGLTNGDTYSVQVRATTAAGVSEPSTAVDVTPFALLDAPADVVVTPGTSSAKVTWSPPATDAGTFDLAGYEVLLNGPEFGGATVCETTLTEARQCLVGLPAGAEFSFFVVAVDSEGNYGQESAIIPTGVIAGPAVPSAVPTKDDGDIVGPAGPISAVTAGQTLVLQGSGFLANSTVQLSLFSAPVSLGTVVTDETGSFSATVTIPAGLSNGTHSLVATGVAPDGSTRNLVITVTVSGGTTTVATASLANTGFETSTSLTAGGLALLAGVGLMVGARRRKTSTEQ